MKDEILIVITLLAGINAFISAPASDNPFLLLTTAIVLWCGAYYFGNKKLQKNGSEKPVE